MDSKQRIAKNLVILLTELAAVFLMVFNILPREAALFLTGLLIFYFVFSPLADSLWVFIASIPLFVALPLTDTFDSMANWRILLVILFLIWFIKVRTTVQDKFRRVLSGPSFLRGCLNLPLTVLSGLIFVFLAIGFLSLFNATDVVVGLKKLLYFINIFMLFFVVREVIKSKEALLRIFQATGVALGLTLIIGYTQLLAVFFTPLYTFWQFWAKQVVPVFYGQALGHLLSYSNTWFSYYSSQPPTLRMFSVFPDSHSFALFCIIGLSFLLTAILLRPKENRKLLFIWYPALIICLLALIFSGSRGIWVSALVTLALSLIFTNLRRILRITNLTNKYIRDIYGKIRQIREIKIPQLILGSLIIFFLLFPISSWFLLLSQKAQITDSVSEDSFLVFERAKSIVDFSEVSAKSRLEIWQRTLDSIMAHPFLGVGIGNYPIVLGEDISAAKRGASAHNLYLDVAAEMGIFALLILLAIFWEILKTIWRVFQQQGQTFKDNPDSREQSLKSCSGACSQKPILLFQCWAGFFGLVLIWILSYSLFDVVLLNDKVLLFFTVSLGILYGAKSSTYFH
jgi:O-antigen ligase